MPTDRATVHQAIVTLGRLTEAFRQRREQLARGAGITEHQWSVLEEISTEHFMPSMFAHRNASSPAAVSKVIAKLAEKGLIRVSLSRRDGRQRDFSSRPGAAAPCSASARRARPRSRACGWRSTTVTCASSSASARSSRCASSATRTGPQRSEAAMGKTLYEKVFERHTVRELPSGQYQLLMGLHLIHEVTSPQAFSMLEERGLSVMFPERTFATVDHIIPTTSQLRPYADTLAEQMMAALERNTRRHGITLFSPESGTQGIVHVVGPEQGLTQPGMTICCGDSHTATHGAFGAIAFGIGTSQVRDVLATQTLSMGKLKVRRVEVNGASARGLRQGRDLAHHRPARRQGRRRVRLRVRGRHVRAHDDGRADDRLQHEHRGRRPRRVRQPGPHHVRVPPGRPRAPQGAAWDRAVQYWESIRSDPDADYDDVVRIDAARIEPMVTWGITPGQSTSVTGRVPAVESFPEAERDSVREAYEYMGVTPGQPIAGTASTWPSSVPAPTVA
jgi:3-isopropylmalate/(R)-2-methylmalate dehydratase large subunit